MNKKNNKFSKGNKFKKKDFSRNSRDSSDSPGVSANICDISAQSKGKRFSLTGFIDRVVQTGGPTVFYVTDGTGTLALKAFVGPGERAHPEIEEGDAIQAAVTIEEFRDELEGEVSHISKLSPEEAKELTKKIKDTQRKNAEIAPVDFLIESPILDKLKERFVKAATEIRLAIFQNRPIIIRHHNDTDGYSSGFTLEKAILPLIEKQHGGGKSAWEFYTRSPCAAPFYEIEDSIKDTAHSLSRAAKFSNKMPLVIIADNGSSQEDLLGILQGKVHGIDFVVVDHHFFEDDVISQEVLVHINPFLVNEDGAKFSAGMLCTELARFINPTVSLEQIPAMAGLADRIDNKKAIDDYLHHASKKGYSKELLNDISTVIDFVSAKLRFMEAREYIDVLFGEPMDKQKALVKLFAPYIRNLEAKGLSMAKSAAIVEKIKSTTLQLLFIELVFPRGFYPKPGKCTGILHDNIQLEKKLTSVVTIGVMPDAITIRATDGANFSVHELIEFLNKKAPEVFAEGGGHKNAGAIKFVPNKQEEVLKLVREYIKEKSK